MAAQHTAQHTAQHGVLLLPSLCFVLRVRQTHAKPLSIPSCNPNLAKKLRATNSRRSLVAPRLPAGPGRAPSLHVRSLGGDTRGGGPHNGMHAITQWASSAASTAREPLRICVLELKPPYCTL